MAFPRFLPHAEIVHEFLDVGGRALDFLLRVVGAGHGGEGWRGALFVSGPDELACVILFEWSVLFVLFCEEKARGGGRRTENAQQLGKRG